MHCVLCYDVVDDGRRRKLYHGLRAFLQPVQKSVFEGDLPADRLDALIGLVTSTIDHETDTVRIYHLCRGCAQLTDHVGTARVIPLEPDDVIM